jgi:hypothetical protein
MNEFMALSVIQFSLACLPWGQPPAPAPGGGMAWRPYKDRFFLPLTGGKYSDMRNEREIDGIIPLPVFTITYTIAARVMLSSA